jgi:Fe-S-cluster formation regulator IscX/YfhJ
MDLKWQNTEDIAIRLVEEHPESDDPKKSNEKILEAIQMAWHEEYQDSKS